MPTAPKLVALPERMVTPAPLSVTTVPVAACAGRCRAAGHGEAAEQSGGGESGDGTQEGGPHDVCSFSLGEGRVLGDLALLARESEGHRVVAVGNESE